MGGAAIAIANARASVSSQQIIKFAGFYVLFLLFFFFFLSENVSSSKSEVIDQRFFALSISFLHFLFVEFESQKSLGRQLTWNVNKDKSIIFKSRFFLNKFRRSQFLTYHVTSLYDLVKVLIKKSKSQAAQIWNSLIRQGIEPNPGPGLTVTSQNCRGLSDPKKLLRILNLLDKSTKIDGKNIVCLQETHVLDSFTLDNHYTGSAVIDNGERNQKGTAILVPTGCRVRSSKISGNGRWAMAFVELPTGEGANELHLVVSVYAPNCHRESSTFFQELFDSMDTFGIEAVNDENETFETIIAGDFNCVLNPALDAANRAQPMAEQRLVNIIKGEMEDRLLVDSAFKLQPGSNRFTWRRGNCYSKLDYVIVSASLAQKVSQARIDWYVWGSTYDHAMLRVSFDGDNTARRGKGYPKLFKSDISSENSKLWLRDQLLQAKSQIQPHWNPHQAHEFLKLMVRSKTLELRTMNKRENSSTAIAQRLSSLISRQALTGAPSNEIEELKAQMAEAEEREAEIRKIQAGVKWREHGEKSTTFFLSKLKARVQSSALNRLVDSQGKIYSDHKGITAYVKEFYELL